MSNEASAETRRKTQDGRATTAANLQLVRALYAAFAKGDVQSLFAVLSPNVEWAEPENPLNPAAGTRHGHAGFLDWLQIGRASEEILALEPHQFIAQDDTVVVVGHEKCLAKPTGRIYDSDFVHLITVSSGKVSRFQEFFDTFAAAEAFRR